LSQSHLKSCITHTSTAIYQKIWQKTDLRFTIKQVARGNWYSQALRQKPGKRQFGDGVVLQALKHYAAAAADDDDDDDDDTSVGFVEGDTAVSLVIVSTGCEDRQVKVCNSL
jgi:hypothetical protein